MWIQYFSKMLALACTLNLSLLPMAHAKSEPDYNQINEIIQKSYQEQMSSYFVNMINASKMHKTAEDFLVSQIWLTSKLRK